MLVDSRPQSLCLYGAGELGQLAVDFCESCGIKVVAVVDRSSEKSLYSRNGNYYITIPIKVYLERYHDIPLYICIATESYNVIKESLVSLGIATILPFYSLAKDDLAYPLNNGWTIESYDGSLEKDVARTTSRFCDNHSKSNYNSFILWHKSYIESVDPVYPFKPSERYILPELIDFLENRCSFLVDVGAHRGQCRARLEGMGIHFYKSHLFEPDPHNFDQLLIGCGENPDIHCYPVALYSCSIETCFQSGYNYCSRLSANGNLRLKTRTLDSYNLECDFLKIHTEGSELEILRGSINTIQKSRPAIAVAVYHNSNGICNIVDWLVSNFPFYRLYFRCHNYQGTGAFLYCIPS